MARHSEETAGDDTIRVNVGTLGSVMKTVVLPAGATVRDALVAAEYDPEAEVKCNGEKFSNGDPLDNGDDLLVLSGSKVKGGVRG